MIGDIKNIVRTAIAVFLVLGLVYLGLLFVSEKIVLIFFSVLTLFVVIIVGIASVTGYGDNEDGMD